MRVSQKAAAEFAVEQHQSRNDPPPKAKLEGSESINFRYEKLARQELEALRGFPYEDEEWARSKSRLLDLAYLVRRWVQAQCGAHQQRRDNVR